MPPLSHRRHRQVPWALPLPHPSTNQGHYSPRVVGLEPHAVPSGFDLLQVRRADHPALEDRDLVALACARVDERERAGAASRCGSHCWGRGDMDGLDERSCVFLLLLVAVVVVLLGKGQEK